MLSEKQSKQYLKEPQTISIYWLYLLFNHVATSTKSKLFVTYTFEYQ